MISMLGALQNLSICLEFRYGDLNINFDIDFPKKLDEDEKELLSSVLDQEEIAKIEQMILKRSISENLNKLNRVSCPPPSPLPTPRQSHI